MNTKIIIYTDGGARGNPGPAAIGVLIGDKEYAETIGRATNNVAEYKAIIFALKKAKVLVGSEKAGETELEVRSDSELIVHQLNGKYKVKDANLHLLFDEATKARQAYKKVVFVHIPREENQVADGLLNDALDALV
ncbi:MAG: ribonuclease HI family protein [Candidatus Paceibacterota bacterium]|jgi:ribonuclease HI